MKYSLMNNIKSQKRFDINIRNIFYYSVSRNLCDKLIKREVYVKSIKFMKKELYNIFYY